nr:MAG TPA: hypothetical protein [Caudoviricetes sp.]
MFYFIHPLFLSIYILANIYGCYLYVSILKHFLSSILL